MATDAYAFLAQAPAVDRVDVFQEAAAHLGTTPAHIEKDLWVCWTLRALFANRPQQVPSYVFRGGTSLSKCFGITHRFSEDVDITVRREDLGCTESFGELEARSRRGRRAVIDGLMARCRAHVADEMQPYLQGKLEEVAGGTARVVIDPTVQDSMTLLVDYNAATGPGDGYTYSPVRVEIGPRSDTHLLATVTVTPYCQSFVNADLAVPGVTVLRPERTTWDKVLIAHRLCTEEDARHPGQASRWNADLQSRHFYDLHMLHRDGTATRAINDTALLRESVRHTRLFFPRTGDGIERAARGSFSITPRGALLDSLAADYAAMQRMILGTRPQFDEVLASVVELERALNTP
ncbi:MAG: nucleotidyl transferase AbiEii/AbiGii toxin family protein [Gemmatimonadales bacterium]|nr:nucleotidyl transferase AbiEii/AbiGii toxin family protein [Gemmatimonadales bacterium]